MILENEKEEAGGRGKYSMCMMVVYTSNMEHIWGEYIDCVSHNKFWKGWGVSIGVNINIQFFCFKRR